MRDKNTVASVVRKAFMNLLVNQLITEWVEAGYKDVSVECRLTQFRSFESCYSSGLTRSSVETVSLSTSVSMRTEISNETVKILLRTTQT